MRSTRNGGEIALCGTAQIGCFGLAACDNRYRDFIDEPEFVGIDPNTKLMLFQSCNPGRVRIRDATYVPATIDHYSAASRAVGVGMKIGL